jgi:hypothetical protein
MMHLSLTTLKKKKQTPSQEGQLTRQPNWLKKAAWEVHSPLSVK